MPIFINCQALEVFHNWFCFSHQNICRGSSWVARRAKHDCYCLNAVFQAVGFVKSVGRGHPVEFAIRPFEDACDPGRHDTQDRQ